MQIILTSVIMLIAIALLAILLKKRGPSFNQKNLLPHAIGSLSVAVICVSSDLKVKFVNASCEKLLKYTSRELIGKKLSQLFEAPDTLAPVLSNDRDTLDTSVLDSQNNKIPVRISLKKIGSGPKPAGFILILTDISEAKKYYQNLEEKTREIEYKKEIIRKLQKELEVEKISIEEKAKKRTGDLEKEHARLLASINDISLCFLMTDKYNNIILNNKAARTIFTFLPSRSFNEGGLLSSTQNIITVAELQKSAQMNLDLNTQIEKARNEKRCINITDVQIGSKFINILISPVILEAKPSPDAIGVAMIIKDQTAQHDLQRSKEDLFNIASHELRTPLTAIYGYTSLIKQIYSGDIQNEELKMIINSIGVLSKKLSLSVSNFLDSSKLEQGKIELKEEQCNLFALINESIKEMEDMALWKNLYIKFDPPPWPIIVTADKIRVTQILNILINNAIKFTRIGGISISVETKLKPTQSINQESLHTTQSELIRQPADASGGLNSVKIIIEDTGTGISEENKKLLFRKFQRTGDNLLTREEGTGLGLHIAKLLITKMRGTIMLEKTEINKGSTFSFTIPISNN